MDGAKLHQQRSLRALRQAQIAMMESHTYRLLEACASAGHTLKYSGRQAVAYLADAVETYKLKERLRSVALPGGLPSFSAASSRSLSSSSSTSSDSDVVTVTKIQFLEQQLAELRALMEMHGVGAGQTPRLTTPRLSGVHACRTPLAAAASGGRSSSSAAASEIQRLGDSLLAWRVAAPPRLSTSVENDVDGSDDDTASDAALTVTSAASSVSMASNSKSTVVADTARATTTSTRLTASTTTTATAGPSAESTPRGRPNMVALVNQASGVKLRSVTSTPRVKTPSTATPARRGNDLGEMLKEAFHKRFSSLRSDDEGWESEEVMSPMASTPPSVSVRRSKSAAAVKRTSVESSVQSPPPHAKATPRGAPRPTPASPAVAKTRAPVLPTPPSRPAAVPQPPSPMQLSAAAVSASASPWTRPPQTIPATSSESGGATHTSTTSTPAAPTTVVEAPAPARAEGVDGKAVLQARPPSLLADIRGFNKKQLQRAAEPSPAAPAAAAVPAASAVPTTVGQAIAASAAARAATRALLGNSTPGVACSAAASSAVVPASAPTPPAKKGALQNVVLRKTGRSVVSDTAAVGNKEN